MKMQRPIDLHLRRFATSATARRLLIILCVCVLRLPRLSAGEPVTGYATDKGTLNLSDADGTLLDFLTLAWGPKFAWTPIKGEATNERGATVATFNGNINGTEVPFTVDLRVSRTAPRVLQVTVGAKAEKDSDLTQIAMAIHPGERFKGENHCVVNADGAEKTRAVPFGKGPGASLGSAVSKIQFTDAEGVSVEIAFAKPATVVADGAARIVLAANKIVGGTRKEVSFTVTLPGDIAWYPTPSDIPYPDNWAQWFEWKPTAALTKAPATPGSGVGMNDWSVEPAGAHGRVVRQGDQLLIDGKPAKFWGLNDCYSACAPEKEIAESRAALYAKMGINAVRLHKYAEATGWAGIQSEESFAEFDPEALDLMDYFIAQLKAKGIYVKLSANFGNVNPGPADVDAIPWLSELSGAPGKGKKKQVAKPTPTPKAAVTPKAGAKAGGKSKGRPARKINPVRVKTGGGSIYLASELQDLLIRQTTNLLRHKNPYTGLTYAEDPAIMYIEEVNENSALFFSTVATLKSSPTLTKRMAERFTDWLAKRYGDETGLNKAWGDKWKDAMADMDFKGESFAGRSIVPAGNPWYYDPDQINGPLAAKKARLLDTMRFMYELQNDFYKRYAKAMRSAGYTGEFTASNWQAGRALSHYYNLHSDYLMGTIDRHNYFGGKKQSGASMLTRAGSGMLSSGACQAADRPFMLSEWIHVFPNEWGVEGPAIIGAYGMGLQGWDVSFIFQNKDNGAFEPRLGAEWAVAVPQILGVFPAVARQVRRGDVAQATAIAARNVHIPSLAAGKLGFDDQYKATGDVKEAESATIPSRSLAVARNAVAFTDEFKETPAFNLASYEKDGALVASTGQLRWVEGEKAHIVIDSPGTQAVVGWAKGETCKLGDVDIASNAPFAAVYVTAAGPTETIRTAKRLIVTTIARARNTDMRMQDDALLERGDAPILIEPVQAEITLKRPGTPTVCVCDHDGNRTAATVPAQGGKIMLDSAKTRTIWYEVVYQ